MQRDDPIPLAGLDDHCAVHQFIRIRGRRPTPEELARCRQIPAVAAPRSRLALQSLKPGVAGLLRRELAQLIDRI